MDVQPLIDAVNSRIAAAIDESTWMTFLPGDKPRHEELLTPLRRLVAGGKRTRALLTIAGSRCVTANDERAITAGAALELYQASALVHDDIVDRAATRRGMPATHIAFSTLHRENNWLGDPGHFGVSAGVLAGDYLLSLSHEVMAHTASAEALTAFCRMTSEVAFGQYLDMRAESAPAPEAAVDAAIAVLTHKSARYSVVLPLQIGALVAGASPELVSQLGTIGLPLGEAFQLRDDHLGVFGNPQVTGKPVAGDIAEGKQTALIALILAGVTDTERQRLTRIMGSTVSPEDAAWIFDLAHRTGALDRHEAMIAEREAAAQDEWEKLRASNGVRNDGLELIGYLMDALRGRRA